MNIIDRITKFGLTCDVGKKHFHCGHEYVEIGGAKWATMNVGAKCATDYGLYFQCGDTKGYTASQVGSGSGQKYFYWTDYKYCKGINHEMTKYNVTDGKFVLEAFDDAVSAAWGGGWRMPTTAEFQALGNAVNSAWTTDYQGSGVHGLVLTDKTDSAKTLFFPAAGFASNGSVYDVGFSGGYWSSSLYSGSVSSAYRLSFDSNNVNLGYNNSRYRGYPVRGVLGENS